MMLKIEKRKNGLWLPWFTFNELKREMFEKFA